MNNFDVMNTDFVGPLPPFTASKLLVNFIHFTFLVSFLSGKYIRYARLSLF